MGNRLFDAGANLTHESFTDDLQAVLDRSYALGVVAASVTAATFDDSLKAVHLIQSTTTAIDLTTTVGFHPHYASQYSGSYFQQMKLHSRHPLVRAIGETGLDYFRDISPRQQQQASFEDHIELAAQTRLPMFLHQRDAHDDFLAIVKNHRDALSRLVVHCFTGHRDMLYAYLDLDCYIGITGWICDSRRGSHLWSLVADIPADRLLIETDCPYLLPPSRRQQMGRRNEPGCLPLVMTTVADHREESQDELALLTYNNAHAFFGIDDS